MITSESCTITERRGFLKNVCQIDAYFEVFKCFDSSTYYVFVFPSSDVILGMVNLDMQGSVSRVCSDDPRSYQGCVTMDGNPPTTHILEPFCGTNISKDIEGGARNMFDMYIYMDSNRSQEQNIITKCDGLCDDIWCLDEVLCNGYRYDFFCDGHVNVSTHILAFQDMCNRILHCNEGTKCLIDNRGSKGQCNFTRCSALIHVRLYSLTAFYLGLGNGLNSSAYRPYCRSYIDQTNCSDPMRGVVPCMIDGYPSTVSKFATCVQNPGLCDDGFDSLCLRTTPSCYVHKHQFCDGFFDCSDKSDETHMICDSMTLSTCFRRYRHETELSIPISWLMDGIKDCMDGEDETEMWPTCGVGSLSRYVPDSSKCEDVYICSSRSYYFVAFQDLCDGHDFCDQAKVCGQSRSSEHVFTNPVATGIEKPLEFLTHCVAGVSTSLGQYISPCVQEDFLPVSIFGLNGVPTIVIPKTIVDCRKVFGKVYVYLSCSGKCRDNPSCPLRSVNHDSCIANNQYRDRVITMENKNRLTFLKKNMRNGKYENNVFLCKNDRCVSYDKVCNLIDDCGDSSDEDNCINNFLCKSSKRFITRCQKCDGKIDCTDYTDECNEDCRTTIISKLSLKVFSWVVGCAAVVLNSVKLFKNLKHLASREFTSALNNKALTTVIHVGDLLTGLYLLTIATLDSLVFAESYCKERFNWLSSDGCAFLGVFSTFGGQISLFSMTILSIFRAIGIIKVQKMTSKYTFAKMVVIIFIIAIASFALAYIPLLTRYEDIFVNGMTYNAKITIFPAFANKETHINKITMYYGRIVGSEVFTWEEINNLINKMFSNQYGGIGRRKIHFYGNDGVCLFKYFVSQQDPQKAYVWSNLTLNFVCFTIMFVCYSKVLFFKKSSKQRARMYNHEDQNRRSRDKEETDAHIAIIIATDFFCWVPFMLVCALHSFGVMDATALYPVSSIVILPINSVINPILYHNYITVSVKLMLNKVRYWVSLFYMRYVRRCLLSLRKVGITIKRKRNVNRSVEMAPQYTLDTNEPPVQEIRPVNRTLPTGFYKNDDTMEIASKSDTSKKNVATLSETEIVTEYFERFQRKEDLASRFSIMRRTLGGIPEECETSQNQD